MKWMGCLNKTLFNDKPTRFALLALGLGLFLGLAQAPQAQACYGKGCSGGGSVDSSTQIMVESFLKQYQTSDMFFSEYPEIFYSEHGPGLGNVYEATQGLGEVNFKLSGVPYKKPWYIVDFSPEFLKRFNEENQEKLTGNGFLRSAELRAVQFQNAVFIDKNFFDEQIRILRGDASEEEKKKAKTALVTLWVKELVRSEEVDTRVRPGEKLADAIGRGDFHRYGMPPMSEADLWAITIALMNAAAKVDPKNKNPEQSARLANEIARVLASSHYGYYFAPGDQLEKDGMDLLNSHRSQIEFAIQLDCESKHYSDVLDTLLKIQAIVRDSRSGYANIMYNRDFVRRLYFFEILNNYLGNTKEGRLKAMQDNFPLTEETAISVCRVFDARKFNYDPNLWAKRALDGLRREANPGSVDTTSRRTKMPSAPAAGKQPADSAKAGT